MGSRGIINLPVVYGGMNNVLSDDKIGTNQAVLLENVIYDEELKKFCVSDRFSDVSAFFSNKKFIKLYEVIYNKEKKIFALTDTGIYNIDNLNDINIGTAGTDIVYNEDGLYFCSENKLYEYKDDVVNDIFHNNIFLSIDYVFSRGGSKNQSIFYHNMLFNSFYDTNSRQYIVSRLKTNDNGTYFVDKDFIMFTTDLTFFIYNNSLYIFVHKSGTYGFRILKYINDYFQEPVLDKNNFFIQVTLSETKRKPFASSDNETYIYSDSQLISLSYYNDIPSIMISRVRNYPYECYFYRFDDVTYKTCVQNYIIDNINFYKNYTYDNIISPNGTKYTISITMYSCVDVTKIDDVKGTLYRHYIICYVKNGTSWSILGAFEEWVERSVLGDLSDLYFFHKVSDNELIYTGYEKFYKITLFKNPLDRDEISFEPEELYLNYPSDIQSTLKIYNSSYDKITNTFYLGIGATIYKLKYITNHDKIPFLLIHNSRLIAAQSSMLLFSGVGDFNNWITNTDSDSLFCEIGYKDSGKIIAGAICYGAIIIFKDNGYIYKLTGDYPNWNVVKIAETDTLTSNLFNYCGSLIFGTKTGIKQLNPSQYYGDFVISDFQNTVIMNDVTSISMSENRKTLIFCSKECVYEYNINLKIFYIYQAKVYNQILEFFNKSTNSYNYYAIDSNGKYYQSSPFKNNITVKRALIQNNQDIVIKSITLFTDVLLKDTEITIYLYDDVSFKRVLKKGLSKHKILLTKRLRQLQIKYIHAGDVFIQDTIIEYETLKGV